MGKNVRQLEYVKVRQGMSRYVKVCQGMSRYVKVCKSMSRYVKVCQGLLMQKFDVSCFNNLQQV